MIILFDIGNTHTHLGLADTKRVLRRADIPTSFWFEGSAAPRGRRFVGRSLIEGAALCSVVPRAPPSVRRLVAEWGVDCLELGPKTVRGIGIDYPKPKTIGPD